MGQSPLKSEADAELQGATGKTEEQKALEKLSTDRNQRKTPILPEFHQDTCWKSSDAVRQRKPSVLKLDAESKETWPGYGSEWDEEGLLFPTRGSRSTRRLDRDHARQNHTGLASPPAAIAPPARRVRDYAVPDTAVLPQQPNLAQPREAAAPRRPYVPQAIAAGPAPRAAPADPPAPARPERHANLHALSQPKLQPFDGRPDAVVDWRAFSSQFTRIANRFQWTDEEKLDRLVESLRDQALVFFSRLEEVDQNDYGRLCIQLGMRFQRQEAPAVLQKRLQEIKQEVDEPLEEFASRTQQLAHDAFPQFGPAVVQPMAVDAFLRGCRDKLPAFSVMNQGPATVQDALVQVKRAQSSQTAVFGSSLPKVRQLRFQGEVDEEPTQVRAFQAEKDVDRRLRRTESDVATLRSDFSELRETVQKSTALTTTSIQELKGLLQKRDSSPKPQLVCFNCQQPGHMSRECPDRSRPRSRSPSPSPGYRSPSPSPMACYNCGRTGHFSRECRERRRPRSRSPTPTRQAENR